MNIKWNYTVLVNKRLLTDIESFFSVKLPEDYISLLNECNSGKPEKELFDISTRKGCVLDYLVNLKDVIKISKNINNFKLIPIGLDPFGNIIAYNINNFGKIESLVFWDHETNTIEEIVQTFSKFLEMLY